MRVEIWSDNSCPWCYIGKRRFDAAVRNLDPKIQVEIEWRSFQLDPSTPKGETSTVTNFLTKHHKIPKSDVDQVLSQIAEAGAVEKITFNLKNAPYVNTFDSHRLVHFAQQSGKGSELKERLLSTACERAESIADKEKLMEVAKDVGLDEVKVKYCLESNQFESDVHEDQAVGNMLEIRNIPFYWINRKYRISGAKSIESLMQVLTEAHFDSEDEEVNFG